MRLGLLADIHEAVEPLTLALARFHELGVDRIITLGDACDSFTPHSRADETAELLREAGAVGVWGNHDFGFCYDVTEAVRERASSTTLAFMATLQPQLTMADCRISHVEPWLDATKIEDLWYFDGPPDTPAKAARSFAAVPERVLFTGHLHRWLATTPTEHLDWHGERPLELQRDQRYLMVIAPVFQGWCAIYDSDAATLMPIAVLT